MAIFLPEKVLESSSSEWLDSVTTGQLCQAYRQYNDYDYDAEHVEWERLRLRHVRVGRRKGVLLDFREHEEGFSTYWLVTYGEADSEPKRCYSFYFDDWSCPAGAWIFEHMGDLTSERLQRYAFDISWHTFVEAVRIHERHNGTATSE